jgi:hypothetical protein
MQYTDQEIEIGITALMDRGQSKASALRTVLNMMHANLMSLVIPAGAKFRFGSGVPASALGEDGDVYDNILTGDRFSKVDGVWTFQYRAKGESGVTPQKGRDYEDGYTPRKGVDYRDGTDGKSAYEVWLGAGNVGSVAVYLQSLRGSATATDGQDGTIWHVQNYDPAATDGNDGDFWQTSVSLTSERRFQKVAGTWRKFYDNTGAATASSSLAVTLAIGVATVTAGNPVVFTAGASGGATPYSYEVTATNTATGASSIIGQSSSGSWSPNTPGIYDIAATVTDSLNATKTSITRTLTVAAASNILPVANAGSDLTITLPTNTVQLMGSGTDADGTIVSQQWTQVTGPNTAVLATASLMNTTASPLIAGIYQFRLTVTDDKNGNKNDDVVITVLPQAAPTITSFTPTAGPAGSTSLQVTGTGFGLTQGTSTVTVNGVQVASVTSWSDTGLRFTVPTGATSGTITVTTPAGMATSASVFTVIGNTPFEFTVFGHSQNSDEAGWPNRLPSWPTLVTQSPDFPTTCLKAGNPSVAGSVMSEIIAIQLTPYNRPVTSGKVPIFTLWGLLNDAGKGRTAEQIKTDIRQFVSIAKANYPASKLIVMTEPYGHAENFYGLTNSQIYDVLNEVAVWLRAGQPGIDAVADLLADTDLNLASNEGSDSPGPNGLHFDEPRRQIVATSFMLPLMKLVAQGQHGVFAPATGLVGYPGQPVITSVAPASVTAGNSVTITGSGFTGTTTISFNGAAAGSFQVVSDTTIAAVVPLTGTSGYVVVSNGYLSGQSPQQLTVLPGAAVTNYGLQFVAANNQYAEWTDTAKYRTLSVTGWQIELRMRISDLTTPCFYLASTATEAAEYAIISGFHSGALEFYSYDNSTGQTFFFALTTAPPLNTFFTVKFVYDGTTLRGYLNNQESATPYTGNLVLGSGISGGKVALAHLGNQSGNDFKASVVFDFLRIASNSVNVLAFEFNETTGTYANTGTAGGSLVLFNSPSQVAI